MYFNGPSASTDGGVFDNRVYFSGSKTVNITADFLKSVNTVTLQLCENTAVFVCPTCHLVVQLMLIMFIKLHKTKYMGMSALNVRRSLELIKAKTFLYLKFAL